MPAVRFRESSGKKRLLHLEEFPVHIGRGSQAEIRVLGDLNISKVHARIVVTERGYVVEDLDSRNGIQVYGRREPRALLRHGAVVTIGNTKIEFLLHDIDGERTPPVVVAKKAEIFEPESEELEDQEDENEREEDEAELEDPALKSSARPAKRRGRRRVSPSTSSTTLPSRLSGRLLLAVLAGLGLITLFVLTNLRRIHRDEDLQNTESAPREIAQKSDVPPATRGRATPPTYAEPTTTTRAPETRSRARRPIGTSTEWPTELLETVLGREPSSDESRTVLTAAHALPSDLVGRLTIASVVASAARDAGPAEDAKARLITLFTMAAGRTPRESETRAILECEANASERVARIAIASIPHGEPAPARRSKSGETGLVLACAVAVDVSDLYSESSELPMLREIARGGVTALDVSAAGSAPLAAIQSLLGNVNSPTSTGLLPRIERAGGGESWVILPDASQQASLTSAGDGGGSAPMTLTWSIDTGAHPALRSLTSAFGQPAPLDDDDLEHLRTLRDALDQPISELELALARGMLSLSAIPNLEVEDIVEAILETRRPRSITILLDERSIPSSSEGASRLEQLTTRLLPSFSGRRGWIAVVSPGSRPSLPSSPGSGFVLAIGEPFRSGRVLPGPNSLADIRASLVRAFEFPGARVDEGISSMFRR